MPRVIKDGEDRSREWLKRLKAGEAAAWGELVRAYSGVLMAVSRRTFAGYGVMGTTQDHEDVVAAVWGNLLENDMRVVDQCLEKDHLAATLCVLAQRRAVDLIRKKGVRREVGEGEQWVVEQHATSDAMEAQERERLEAAMGQLSEKERTLVRLFYLHEKSYKEIEVLTGVGVNSIGPTIQRAVGKLRRWLTGESGDQ